MAFPTTGILDDFNRANTGPPPSSSWGSNKVFSATANNLIVSSNAITSGNTNFQSSWWNPSTFGPDAECYITCTTLPAGASDEVAFVMARLATPGGTGVDGYGVAVTKQSGTDLVEVYRIDNAAQTLLGASMSQEFSAGDSIGVECSGSSIRAHYKASGGSWTQLGSRTDSTYSAAGNVGVELFSTTVRLDDFGGGTVVTGGGATDLPPRRALLGVGR